MIALNPKTGRTVKTGTALYKKLVREGHITEENQEKVFKGKRVYKLEPEDDAEEIREELEEELEDELEMENTQIVKGRGCHKDHLVKRRASPGPKKIIAATTSLQKKRSRQDHVLTALEKRIAKSLGLNSDGEGCVSSDESE